MCDIVVKKFTFAISSPDEFLFTFYNVTNVQSTKQIVKTTTVTYFGFVARENCWLEVADYQNNNSDDALYLLMLVGVAMLSRQWATASSSSRPTDVNPLNPRSIGDAESVLCLLQSVARSNKWGPTRSKNFDETPEVKFLQCLWFYYWRRTQENGFYERKVNVTLASWEQCSWLQQSRWCRCVFCAAYTAAVTRNAFQWAAQPQKIALGDLNHGSWGLLEPPTQTASRSVHPFLHFAYN